MIGWMTLALSSATPALPTMLLLSTEAQVVRASDPREEEAEDDRAREKKSAPRAERREKKGDNCRRTFWSSSCRIGSAPSPFES